MSTEDNKALMRSFYDAWEQNDHDNLAALLAADVSNYFLETGLSRTAIEFELATCELWHEAFSEVKFTFTKIVSMGDHISLAWMLDSVHTGTFLGIPPTGYRVSVPGIELVRIQDGKIAEIWRLFDQHALMAQLRPPPRSTTTVQAVTD